MNNDATFKTILYFVGFMACMSATIAVGLTVISSPMAPDKYQQLIAIFMDTFQLCVGALIGAIGARSLSQNPPTS